MLNFASLSYFLVEKSLLRTSMYTAIIIIEPIKTCCQKTLTFIKFRPLRSIHIIITPAKTPRTVPLPPKKLAPPIITAAIASSSDCKPVFG